MRVFQFAILSYFITLFHEGYSQEKKTILPLEERVTIFPNPVVDGVLKVEILDDNEGNLTIYDFLGNEVYDLDLNIPEVHKYKLFLNELSQGNYFVRININNEVVTRKISIL